MDKYFKANAVFSIFSRDYMELKKDLPIRPSEMAVLNIISRDNEKYTPLMIAELLGVSKPMIANHLSVLDEKGYIYKDFSSSDKRSFYIMPTDKGKKLVLKEEKKLNKKLKEIENSVGRENFELLVNLIEDINKFLELDRIKDL